VREIPAEGRDVNETLNIVALLGTGTVTGVFFAVAVSVLPTLFALPAGQYITVHRLLGKGYHPSMPLIVNAATIADVVLLITTTGTAQLLSVAALVAMIGVQCVSHLCNVPINRSLHNVDPDDVPPQWQDPRPAWRSWHLVRTGCAVVALLTTSAAAVVGH
jgi:uncharacterized membrane protein